MASRGINKVILIGYLGQEPEVRYTSGGHAVTNISIATTDSWKDKQTNELKEKTEWHRVVLFGKIAEIASEYLHKGSQVYIEGALRTRKWQQQNGEDRYITEIIVNIGGVLQMLGGGGKRRTEEDSNVVSSSDKYMSDNNVTETLSDNTNISFVDSNDDIPF